MNGEPQPADAGDKLDRAVFGLKSIWYGLFSGAVVLVVTMTAIVFSNNQPNAIFDASVYAFLAAVPIGLAAAYVISRMMIPTDPSKVVRPSPGRARCSKAGKGRSRGHVLLVPQLHHGVPSPCLYSGGFAMITALGFS